MKSTRWRMFETLSTRGKFIHYHMSDQMERDASGYYPTLQPKYGDPSRTRLQIFERYQRERRSSSFVSSNFHAECPLKHFLYKEFQIRETRPSRAIHEPHPLRTQVKLQKSDMGIGASVPSFSDFSMLAKQVCHVFMKISDGSNVSTCKDGGLGEEYSDRGHGPMVFMAV